MLLKFTSPTCQPCKELNRQIQENFTQVEFDEIDVTRNPDIVMQYGVRSVPTVVNVDTSEVFVGMLPILNYLRKQYQ